MNLEAQIAKIIEAYGAALYDMEVVTEFDETVFRIYITKAGGVNLDLCAAVSNELSPFFDVHPPVSGQYRLEVSSPGIERKLTKPIHFKHAIGEKVKIKIPGQERFKGTLKSADDNGIIVETKEGEASFAYAQLGSVKTYFEWNN
ncbi:MAG: ribosome maturation factor RimP [Campylobacterota bacterium]|nr:ribosome maturation factor RimP [Campylobacterota bacterium]